MSEYSVKPLVPVATEGNLTELIAHRAWFEPERVIMSRPLGDGWQPVTAREVEAEVRATAKGLVAAGINIGDRVAIMARTRYEWTILDFAIWFAGGCVVPIYETSSAEQVDWILSDSGAVGLIVETPTHRELAQVTQSLELSLAGGRESVRNATVATAIGSFTRILRERARQVAASN